MKITAAVVRETGAPFSIEDAELDSPRPGEVLVRIVGVGLCHTDVLAREGGMRMRFPAVFGHEGAGIVESVGEGVTKVKPGDRVVLTFGSCGHCPTCDTGEPAYCHNRVGINYGGTRPDGSFFIRGESGGIHAGFFAQSSFGTHALARERNVVKIRDEMPLEIAGALGCGLQTGAGAVMRSLNCPKGSSIVILGGGSVGLAAVMGAALQGCDPIIVVEPHQSRREMALSLGATHAFDPRSGDLQTAFRQILPVGAAYVLDTSGAPAAIESVTGFLAPRGTFGFVGVPPVDRADLKLPGTLREALGGGFTYRGIVEGDSDPDVFIPELVDRFLEGRFAFDRFVKTYRLDEINQAVDDQHEGWCIKAVLIP